MTCGCLDAQKMVMELTLLSRAFFRMVHLYTQMYEIYSRFELVENGRIIRGMK